MARANAALLPAIFTARSNASCGVDMYDTKKLLKVEHNILPKIEMTQEEKLDNLLPLVEFMADKMSEQIDPPKYADFADRLKKLMTQPESSIKSVNDLKDAAGVSYEMARRYTLGTAKPRDEKLQKLSEVFCVSAGFLDHGIEDAGKFDTVEKNKIKTKNKEKILQSARWVPVKSYSAMGLDGYYTDMGYEGNGGDGYIPSLTASPSAYAVKGTGVSMYPAVRDGWFLVCDPEAIPVTTEFVHVILKNGKSTIKEFLGFHGGYLHLLAVNGEQRLTFESSDVDCVVAVIDIVPPSRRVRDFPLMQTKDADLE